jgi:hypothetical protein
MPVSLPMWALASLKVARADLRALPGAPHFVETDPRRTCGGEEDGWAYALPSGHRVLIMLDAVMGAAALCADPPDLGPVLRLLGSSQADPRLVRHAEPMPLR